jgi:hypothetical protein
MGCFIQFQQINQVGLYYGYQKPMPPANPALLSASCSPPVLLPLFLFAMSPPTFYDAPK